MNNLINEINLRRGIMKLPGSRLLVILYSVALLCSAGCGEGTPSDTPELGNVTGTVTMDGKPLANVVVTFEPESGKPSFGGTDAEGHYDLVYSKNEKGAKIGLHTVRITTPTEGPEDKGKDPVPAKYNTKSTLKKEVKAGTNEINLELTSK
jgi:hypothetical protein